MIRTSRVMRVGPTLNAIRKTSGCRRRRRTRRHQEVCDLADQALEQPPAILGTGVQVEHVDGLQGGARLGQHRHALAGHDDRVGERQVAQIRVFRGIAGPSEDLRRTVERRLERRDRLLGRTRAGADQQRTVPSPGEGACRAAQQRRGFRVQNVRPGVAADHDGGIRPRQVGKARRPDARGLAQALIGDPLQGRGVVQHVRPLGQAVLRRGDHQVEVLDPRPGTPDVHEADALVGMRLDPPARRLVAPARGDDQIRPGRDEGAGFIAHDPEQGERRQQVGQELGRSVDQMLDLEWPAQAFGERQNLRVVPGLVAHHHPGAGIGRTLLGRSSDCHQRGAATIR